jgi:serine palmitoyltransferase
MPSTAPSSSTHYSALTVPQLKSFLKSSGLSTQGKKAELVQRLVQHGVSEDGEKKDGEKEDGEKEDGSDADPDPYSDVRVRLDALSAASPHTPPVEHTITWFAAMTTYLGYAVLIIFGHIRDFLGMTMGLGSRYKQVPVSEPGAPGATGANMAPPKAPLLKSWENFYTRRLYHRIQDCFNRPVGGDAGASCRMSVIERVSYDNNKTMCIASTTAAGAKGAAADGCGNLDNFKKGDYNTINKSDGYIVRKCINLGSYNYLGFADDWNDTCKTSVLEALETNPVSCASSRIDNGTTSLHTDLEKLVARFLNKDDALVLNMGFNTNATTIPSLCGKGDLLISDALNHTSIVAGARSSKALIRVFKHNDAHDLESVLKEAIVMGQPRTRRPWKKIMVCVEGIYSMEGEYCNLKAIVKVCKKYKAFIYLDEAHSIGAMGATGRGVCEYAGVDTKDVDVLMGTFTKSFGGMGGYIAANQRTIDYLRTSCAGSLYHNSLSPIVCQQVLTAFRVILGEDGTDAGARKIKALRDNANYLRMRLSDMGLHVLGNYDSPILPVMLYNPTKIAAFSRECYKRGLAVVVVGFPAVPILMSRARFCVSAGHTRQDLDEACEKIEEVASLLKLRYARSAYG